MQWILFVLALKLPTNMLSGSTIPSPEFHKYCCMLAIANVVFLLITL